MFDAEINVKKTVGGTGAEVEALLKALPLRLERENQAGYRFVAGEFAALNS